MQYLVVAYDGTDPEAPARRQRCRGDHLAGIARLRADGHVLYGGAMLDERGQPIGSAAVFEFADRAQLNAWLEQDPYVVGRVWERISVHPFQPAPLATAPPAPVL